MKRLGSTVDWSREYFTMDDRLSVAVKEAFVRLYEQGLIYRGAYIVNWCPGCQTAISDLEVIHEEQLGKLYEIRYPLADGSGSIVIATTRPETMLGDTAVAVNPEDPRYTALVGKLLKLPLVGREIPIIADDWAKPEFGTGAVKVTPAHDPNDFAIGQRHHLPNLNIMDTTAHIELPGSPYHGLDRFEGPQTDRHRARSTGFACRDQGPQQLHRSLRSHQGCRRAAPLDPMVRRGQQSSRLRWRKRRIQYCRQRHRRRGRRSHQVHPRPVPQDLRRVDEATSTTGASRASSGGATASPPGTAPPANKSPSPARPPPPALTAPRPTLRRRPTSSTPGSRPACCHSLSSVGPGSRAQGTGNREQKAG